MDFTECVTPRAGVWIEIWKPLCSVHSVCVTPRAGVWIEIYYQKLEAGERRGHSPCGSVD